MRVLAITQCFPPRRSTFSSRSACLTTHLAERRDSMQVVAFLSSSRQLGNLRHEVLEQYRWADTVLIMLRDWATMRETVPSKPYEALLTGCHISAAAGSPVVPG